ncbi:MAG TPA: DinB family protein [Vicinamibacterales bacterium]|nr:DinB family protein [Vicinamibacterales bacterium]
MRRGFTVGVGVLAVMLAAASAMAQERGGDQGRGRGRGAPAAPACTTVACDIQSDWEFNRQGFVGIVNAMPEDKFGFKPTPAQESFAERVMHIVNIDVKLLSTLGGKTPAPMIKNPKATAKADVVAALNQSMDYGAALLKEFNDQQLSERVTSLPFMGPTVSRLRVAYFSIAHTQDIYGQLAVYLRLNGVTPPRSVRP